MFVSFVMLVDGSQRDIFDIVIPDSAYVTLRYEEDVDSAPGQSLHDATTGLGYLYNLNGLQDLKRKAQYLKQVYVMVVTTA